MHTIPTPAMLNAARSVRGRRPSRRPARPSHPPATSIRASAVTRPIRYHQLAFSRSQIP
jgi:hypothetical protein